MTPALLAIIASIVPELPALVQSIASLRKKYPALTPEQIQALVADITTHADSAFDDVLAKIEGDKAKV